MAVTRWKIEEDHQLAKQATALGLIPATLPELLRQLHDTVIPAPRRD